MNDNMRVKWYLILLLLGILMTYVPVAAAPNPVLPGVADAGVLRYNGAYHLMGVGTSGTVWQSRDLVNWTGPHQAFSMHNEWATGAAGASSEIHACDLVLHQGTFHLYWSVNYRALRAIGHAVADTVLGPYHEPTTDAPFDGRIDPQLFVDYDGRCYFYTTKFLMGNSIYGQAMDGPATLTGKPVRLLSAVPDSWERLDHNVNEASFTRRYRDRYYMLYNANHTGLEYGNYAIGCAVAHGPLDFNNELKYPFYLLRDNWERLQDNAHILSAVSRDTGVRWKYTFVAPEDNWTRAPYDDADWLESEGSFGNTGLFMKGGTLRTHWDSEDIWLRRRFSVDHSRHTGDLHVLINHNREAEVFINGTSMGVFAGSSGGYMLIPASNAVLQQGENILALHCRHDGEDAQYIDAGLYLFTSGTAEPVIVNCGQPTLVRGPNNFEWWLVYFAVYNGEPRRGQAIDRVHFFDRELYIEGPTSNATPGQFLQPARPTYQDHFDGASLADTWRPGTGAWHVENNQLYQSEARGLHRVNMTLPLHTHYLFETTLRFLDDKGRQIGIIAWERGPEQALYIALDQETNTWFWAHRQEFVVRTEIFNMPDSFNWTGPVMVRVQKNGAHFMLYINDVPAPGNAHIFLREAGAGRPGLVTRDSAAAFSGVTFTAGWDEYDNNIRGWDAAADGTPETGVWGIGAHGLIVEPEHVEARTFKGDLLKNFEWNVQILAERSEAGAEVGCYAWYLNKNNFVRVALNADHTEVTVTGKHKGNTLPRRIEPVRLRAQRLLPVDHGGINLRIVRIDNTLTLFTDGLELLQMTGDWPPAQVGLFAQGVSCQFNGITLFEHGQQ